MTEPQKWIWWEDIPGGQVGTPFAKQSILSILRAKVPGGWLISVPEGKAPPTFYPDPEYNWDGNSLP